MFKCDNCGREFNLTSALGKHRKSCVKIENETMEHINEMVSKNELSDNVKRKLAKLRDSYLSTWDAEARHNIQQQIKDLEGLL